MQIRLYILFLSHPVSFPFLFSLQHPLFSSLFSRGNHQIFRALSRDPSLRLVWGRPKISQICEIPGICKYTWKPPVYLKNTLVPATAWVSCRFPQFCVRFCPRPALRLRETREFPEWSTKHPLFSLEISGNAKCWGPSVFLFVCLGKPRTTAQSVLLCPVLALSLCREAV